MSNPAEQVAPTAGAGRYAPSPSGALHLGNLRTAVIAENFARRSGRSFLLRVDDLDPQRSRAEVAREQIADLARLGLQWDGEPEWQSDNHARYSAALEHLSAEGRTFECFCSRKDILDAPRAPHAPPGAYPGTCRDLTAAERERRRTAMPSNKVPAIRVRADSGPPRGNGDSGVICRIHDVVQGEFSGVVDDFVLRRGDGAWAYNLAVVVDDAAAGVDQVVRGLDLLDSAPRQAWLARQLGLAPVEYAHVPLAVAPGGARLAKRDGGHTLAELVAGGVAPEQVVTAIGESVGVPDARSVQDIAARFEPALLAPGAEFGEPWVVPGEW